MVNGATPEIKEINRNLREMSLAVAQAQRAMTAQSAKSAAAISGLTSRTAAATTAVRGFSSALRMSDVSKFGKNLQWTGRQIEYNFTLPLVLAAGAATKWALDQEKSFVQVRKVYGDNTAAVNYWKRQGLSAFDAQTKATQVFNDELSALDRVFTALSSTMGVAKTDVNTIAGEWAAAGASGMSLAKSVQLTMQAMILGDMGAADATKALISIQAQYGASTNQLKNILGALNSVENQTGATMSDLIEGFSRAAGAASTAGVGYRQLAAMIAALVPAAGSATSAGNSLKTMFSRILAPSSDAMKLMGRLGLSIDSAGWASKNMVGRMHEMATALAGATNGQKAVVAAYVASRYQVNRFDILMKELISDHGYYAKALHATANETKIAATYQKELTQVMTSQPRQFAIVKETLRNTLVQAIIPFIPAILAVAQKIADLAQQWQNLDPHIQLLIVSSLAFIAVFGTMTRILGAGILLFSTLGGAVFKTLIWVARMPGIFAATVAPIGAAMTLITGIVFNAMRAVTIALLTPALLTTRIGLAWIGIVNIVKAAVIAIRAWVLRLIPAMLGPWGIVVAGVAAAMWTFRSQIGDAINWVINGFNKMPAGIANAFRNIIQVIAKAVEIVKDWLSWLNPFQRHSPSLVDNVNAGVAAIAKKYASLRGIGAVYRQAAADLKAFGRATAGVTNRADAMQHREDRRTVVAGAGAAGGRAYDRLTASMTRLQAAMTKVSAVYTKQAAVVAHWQNALDKANDALDKQQAKLSDLQAVADAYQKQLSSAQDHLDSYVNAPLVGEKAMNQAILDNQVAQSKLNLQMMRMEDVTGPIDDVRNKFALLQGDIENLSGIREDLRSAGAGSDITGVYDQQIKSLRGQQGTLSTQVKQYDDMQKSLDALNHTAQELDLEKYLNFDSVHDQINLLIDDTKELTKGDILAGIAKWKPEVDRLTAAYDKANAAVEKQQAVVDAATAARDKLQKTYDREQKALDALGTAYDAMEQRYQAMADAMSNFVDASKAIDDAHKKAKEAKKAKHGASGPKLAPSEQAFINAGKGDFKDANLGKGLPMRKDWSSQAKGLNKFADQIMKQAQDSFGSLDMFAPLKDMWNGAMKWLDKHVPDGIKNFITSMKDNLKNVLAGAGIGAMIGEALGGPVGAAIGAVLGAMLGNVLPKDFFPKTLGTIQMWLTKIGDVAKSIWSGIWGFFGPELSKMGTMVGHFFSDLYHEVKTQLGKVFSGFDMQPTIDHLSALWKTLKVIFKVGFAALTLIWKVGLNVLIEIAKPILDFIVKLIGGIIRIIGGIFKVLIGLVTGNWSMMWSGLKDIFFGAWNILVSAVRAAVELLIAPFKGMAEGIASWWQWMVDHTSGILNDFFVSVRLFFQLLWEVIGPPIEFIVKKVVGFFTWLYDVLVGHSIIPDLIDAIFACFKLLISLPGWVYDHVLKPVFDFFVKLWNDTKTELAQWWARIKSVWNDLLALGGWVKNNVLTPVFGVFVGLWADTKAELAQWLGRIKNVWNDLLGLGGWFKASVLTPIYNKVVSIWSEDIRPELAGWFGKIKTVWDNLTGLGGWFGDHVLGPIKQAFIDGWNGIRDWFKKNGGIILKPIGSVIAGVARIINLLIDGLNKIAQVLPGLSWHIDDITPPDLDKLAAGGTIKARQVGSGFMTNGARAIVGEGRASHPEFVIPTDPTYRKRALSLFSQLGGHLGATPPPMFFGGGVLGGIGDLGKSIGGAIGSVGSLAKGGLDWVVGNIEKLASTAFNVARGPVNDMIAKIPWDLGRQMASSVSSQVFGWVDAADKEYADRAKKAVPGDGHAFPVSGTGDWSEIAWRGVKVNVHTEKMIEAAERLLGYGIHIIQGSYNAGGVAASAGTHDGGGVVDVSPVTAAVQDALRKVGFAAWIRDPSQGPWGYHIHAVAIGDPTESPLAQQQWHDYLNGGNGLAGGMAMGGIIPAMAMGGIVRRRAGGILARIGEGRHDEAVIPLPSNWNSSPVPSGNQTNETHIHITGDLSFPNIDSGEDAKVFIENLKTLAGGAAA